ncbi:hypothetical protein [Campylobacter hyointestinalis]|uniref:hypothetical protein n=1 Tax=Campylobacter hyointestinalis TaxID=198 RepID=UPI000DCC20D2|nr:hypothetical protein [Campylobacter hyointestinalis]RAZ59611.1 hypothetical protein CHL10071_08945 [Campylobacter hyointestinalis subsp. lawsonii]
MSKKESIKAYIDFLKTLISIFLTAIFAVVGWLGTTYKNADFIDFIFVGIALICLWGVLFMGLRAIKRKFKELEELE